MAEPTKADQAAATEIARWFWGDDGSLEVSEDEMLPIAAIIAKHMEREREVLEAAKKESDHIDMILDSWAWAIHPSELSARLRNIKKTLDAAIAAAEGEQNEP